MTHLPQKCKICGEYHCLAGCVPVEACRAKVKEVGNECRMALLSQIST